MKAELTANDESSTFKNDAPSTYKVILTGTLTGNLHPEFLETKSFKYGDDEVEEYDVIDEFLPKKIQDFIPKLVKDFSEKTGIEVSGYGEQFDDYETENYPRNEEDTKNVNIKIKVVIHCEVPKIIYHHSSEII